MGIAALPGATAVGTAIRTGVAEIRVRWQGAQLRRSAPVLGGELALEPLACRRIVDRFEPRIVPGVGDGPEERREPVLPLIVVQLDAGLVDGPEARAVGDGRPPRPRALTALGELRAQVRPIHAVRCERCPGGGQPEERRGEVDVTREPHIAPSGRRVAGDAHDERHVDEGPADHEPVVAVPGLGPELAELLPVIGGDGDDRPVAQAAARELLEHLVDPVVGVGDLGVVAVVVVRPARGPGEGRVAGVCLVRPVRVHGVHVEEEGPVICLGAREKLPDRRHQLLEERVGAVARPLEEGLALEVGEQARPRGEPVVRGDDARAVPELLQRLRQDQEVLRHAVNGDGEVAVVEEEGRHEPAGEQLAHGHGRARVVYQVVREHHARAGDGRQVRGGVPAIAVHGQVRRTQRIGEKHDHIQPLGPGSGAAGGEYERDGGGEALVGPMPHWPARLAKRSFQINDRLARIARGGDGGVLSRRRRRARSRHTAKR